MSLAMNNHLYHLQNVLRTSFIGNSCLYHTFRFLIKRKSLDKTINYFAGQDISVERRKELKKLLRTAMIKYHWEFDEFFLFDFEHSSMEKIRQFVPEFEKNAFCDRINDPQQADVFLDKWTTYQYFKDYFKRDVCNIRSLEDLESDAFLAFINAHHSFIFKPVFAALGHGIRVIHSKEPSEAKAQLADLFHSGIKAFVLEELIVQDNTMASFHPQSVNTLRIATLRFNDRIEIIHPRIRLGRGEAVVDNAGSGGIIGNIDLSSGVIYAACDKKGTSYEYHPDTNVKIVGFKVPRFDEAVQLVKQLAQVLPKVRYVGWDIALRPDGWVMIEGNDKGQFGFQYPKQEGFAEELNKLKSELLREL